MTSGESFGTDIFDDSSAGFPTPKFHPEDDICKLNGYNVNFTTKSHRSLWAGVSVFERIYLGYI